MGFVRAKPRAGKGSTFGEYVRISQRSLSISKEFWEQKLGRCVYVELYYDEQRQAVAFAPGIKGEGWKVIDRGKVPIILLDGFMSQMKITLEHPLSCKVEPEGKLWVLQLKNAASCK